jgi:hypothetical protein
MKNTIILVPLSLCFLVSGACTNTNTNTSSGTDYYKTYVWEEPVRIPESINGKSTRLPVEVEKLINASPFFKGPPINKKFKISYLLRRYGYNRAELFSEDYVKELWQISDGGYLKRTRIEAANDISNKNSQKLHYEDEYVANGLIKLRTYLKKANISNYTSSEASVDSQIVLLKVSGTVFPARKGRNFSFLVRKDIYAGSSLLFRNLVLNSCTWGDTQNASKVWSQVTNLPGDIVALSCKVLYTSSSSTTAGKSSYTSIHYFSKYLRMFVDGIFNIYDSQSDSKVTDEHAQIIRQ